jgi:hypothetical protein
MVDSVLETPPSVTGERGAGDTARVGVRDRANVRELMKHAARKPGHALLVDVSAPGRFDEARDTVEQRDAVLNVTFEKRLRLDRLRDALFPMLAREQAIDVDQPDETRNQERDQRQPPRQRTENRIAFHRVPNRSWFDAFTLIGRCDSRRRKPASGSGRIGRQMRKSCAVYREFPNAHWAWGHKKPRGAAAGMGGTRLELVTSTMSTWRSNQLS